MSDYQNATATYETAHTAVVAKPRISADAFRNLTARLKKPDIVVPNPDVVVPNPDVVVPNPDVVVPNIVAEIVVAPNLAVETPVSSPVQSQKIQAPVEMVQAAPVVLEMVEAKPAVVEHANAMPMLAEALPKALEFEPVVKENTPIDLAPVAAAPMVELAFEPALIPAECNNVALVETVEIEAIPLEPVQLDVAEAAPLEKVYAYPLLAEPVVLQPVAVAVAPQSVVENNISDVKGSFEENFTYVPEPGKAEKQPDLAAIDEAVKQGVAERATELELENIWRLLLAKPTAEDRLHYLREAKEIHGDDDEWNKPEPEHDLSRIEPAEIEPPIKAMLVESETIPTFIDRSLADNLPVAEGQDLYELTRSLLDMMAAGNSSGLPQERALAADTLLRLVPRLESKPLIMLGQRLAMMDNPPQLLVSRLIRDPRVEIAGPLLEDCPHIGDKDLEQVVQEGEPAKLRMVARRRRLSRAISEALIKSGDPSVVLTLVRNMEAEISHDGFQSLLVLCENHEELLAPLATRQDLSAPFAFEMFWLAPVQLRRFILSRFLTDSETLTKILKITMAANSDEEGEAEPLNQHALLEALERAARGQIEIASEELAAIMQVSAATVGKILSDVEGDALVVMLKAAAYPRSSMTGLLKRMQNADLPLVSRDRDLTELQSMFETLSFNKARILLTYWDWAQGKTGPYAAAH
jgi:uncharacterized protein (DUF2336 family)